MPPLGDLLARQDAAHTAQTQVSRAVWQRLGNVHEGKAADSVHRCKLAHGLLRLCVGLRGNKVAEALLWCVSGVTGVCKQHQRRSAPVAGQGSVRTLARARSRGCTEMAKKDKPIQRKSLMLDSVSALGSL